MNFYFLFPPSIDRYVIVGNHRDSLAYGAVDPGSGTACLMEVARVLSVLVGKGQGSAVELENVCLSSVCFSVGSLVICSLLACLFISVSIFQR